MDAGAIEPRNTEIFPAAWLESSLEETAVMGGGRGRLGEGGNRSAGAAKRSEKAPPPLRKHWRKSKRTAMAPPPPRGWTVERSVLTEGVQEKLQLQFWQRGEFAHRRMGKEGQRISHHRRRGSTAGDGHGRRESGGCIVFTW